MDFVCFYLVEFNFSTQYYIVSSSCAYNPTEMALQNVPLVGHVLRTSRVITIDPATSSKDLEVDVW